jgi:hypothetical protein
MGAKDVVPVKVGLGLISPYAGLVEVREFEDLQQRWKEWERERLFIGAAQDHPDGILAESGEDMVCMTSEEFEHWYG